MTMKINEEAQAETTLKRRPGRPRREEDYTCVSVTISANLIKKIDELARQWGMNRSGAVTRI